MPGNDIMEATTIVIAITVSIIAIVVVIVTLLLVFVFRKCRRGEFETRKETRRRRSLWAATRWRRGSDGKASFVPHDGAGDEETGCWSVVNPQRWSTGHGKAASSNRDSSSTHELVVSSRHLAATGKAGSASPTPVLGAGWQPNPFEDPSTHGFAGSPRMAQALDLSHSSNNDSDDVARGTGNARINNAQLHQDANRRSRATSTRSSLVLGPRESSTLSRPRSMVAASTAPLSAERAEMERRRPFYQALAAPPSTSSLYSQPASATYSSLAEETNNVSHHKASEEVVGLGLDLGQPAEAMSFHRPTTSSKSMATTAAQQRLTSIGEITEDHSSSSSSSDGYGQASVTGDTSRPVISPQMSSSSPAIGPRDATVGVAVVDASLESSLPHAAQEKKLGQHNPKRQAASELETAPPFESRLEAMQRAFTAKEKESNGPWIQRPRAKTQGEADKKAACLSRPLLVRAGRSTSVSGATFDMVSTAESHHELLYLHRERHGEDVGPETVTSSSNRQSKPSKSIMIDGEVILNSQKQSDTEQASGTLKSKVYHLPTSIVSSSPQQESKFSLSSDPFSDEYVEAGTTSATGDQEELRIQRSSDLSVAELSDTSSSAVSSLKSPLVASHMFNDDDNDEQTRTQQDGGSLSTSTRQIKANDTTIALLAAVGFIDAALGTIFGSTLDKSKGFKRNHDRQGFCSAGYAVGRRQ
ncbi:hypothetical protein FA10DRAFT_301776 [Acaromyces ingoldii]|uniref:Uncharacterized protein n=1 Tax=Acaromyces ingoldii TaxID=215250 RepID=A0A316YME1_9BASI|nr:hypothetical protein FA10DRAFT_301776 [Acaromyces ingoldii]PWN90537.1 hypothetical protein FA10DRAFT_301776 [Acaromyces ingoldii]